MYNTKNKDCQFLKENKLIKLIKTLQNIEIKKIKNNLTSSNQPELLKLLEHLDVWCKNNHEPTTTKQEVYKFIYGNVVYNDKKLRYTMSSLVQYIEEVLVNEAIRNNESTYRMHLSQVYFDRNLLEYSNYNIKHGNAKVQAASIEAYKLEAQNFESNFLGTRTAQVNIKEISEELDQFFIIEKLRWMHVALSHQNIYNANYSFTFKDEILNQAVNYEANNPQIFIYKTLFNLQQQTENTTLFIQLKDKIQESFKLFSHRDIYNILLLLINICIKHINKNKFQYSAYAMELYKFGFANFLFHDRGFLGPFTFKNAIVISLKSKEYAWAESQIEILSKQLEAKHQISFKAYCLSKLYFEQKKYKDALKWLHKVSYDDVMLSLDAKSSLLKIYFELNEIEPLINHLNSFKTFIKRKTISPFHQKNFINLIKITEYLIKVQLYDKPIGKALELINTLEPLTSKVWLLEQVDKFKKHH